MDRKKAYMHDYSGLCAPGEKVKFYNKSFSVGIFQWIPKSNGKGLKKSAVKVRVRGWINKPNNVYKEAERICKFLDKHGRFGKKYVSVF